MKMSYQEHTSHYWKLEKLSLLYAHYAFVDTEPYLADGLFIKHQVTVHFAEEYAKQDTVYRIVFCKVRKRDEARFLAALRELPPKMLVCGHTDYLDFCASIQEMMTSDREEAAYGKDGPAEQAE